MLLSGCAQYSQRWSFLAGSLFALLLFSVFFAGCTHKEVKPAPAAPVKKPVFNFAQTVESARLAFSKGDYAGAVGICRAAEAAHPSEEPLRAGCSGLYKDIRVDADRFYEKKDCATAGWLYYLLDGQKEAPGADARRIKGCSTRLENEGLALYRQGKLQAAIVQWRKALLMDPANAEIRKAAGTAETQLKTLRTIN